MDLTTIEWTCSRWSESLDGSEQQCNDDTEPDEPIGYPLNMYYKKIVRGGSWGSNPEDVRASFRSYYGNYPHYRGNDLGFRVLC